MSRGGETYSQGDRMSAAEVNADRRGLRKVANITFDKSFKVIHSAAGIAVSLASNFVGKWSRLLDIDDSFTASKINQLNRAEDGTTEEGLNSKVVAGRLNKFFGENNAGAALALSGNATAENQNTLVAGSSSNADAIHTHDDLDGNWQQYIGA